MRVQRAELPPHPLFVLLAAFRAVKEHPGRQIVGKILEAMLDTRRHEDYVSGLAVSSTAIAAPELTASLLERIVAQSEEQAKAHPHGDDIAALERWRDDMLVAILKARADL